MKKNKDIGNDEEAEALIVGSNSDNSGSSSFNKSLARTKKKATLYFGFLGLILVLGISFLAFLFGGGGAKDPESASTGSYEKSLDEYREDRSNHDAIAAQQINNFWNGNALMINVHITHHGGTDFCSKIGRRFRTPSYLCLGTREKDHVGDDYPGHRPWYHGETARNVEVAKEYFDFISWEWAEAPDNTKRWYDVASQEWKEAQDEPGPQIKDTNWENPSLVSVIVMRDPLSRLLAGSGYVKRNYPNVLQGSGSIEEWREFANDDKITDNYALRILAGNGCCNGSSTDPMHLQNAKDLVSRFTFVLDLDCLNEGMQELADQLGMNIRIKEDDPRKVLRHQHKPPKDRIPYPEIYDFLKERNKLDIELYEWSQSLSLVDCSAYKEDNSQFADGDVDAYANDSKQSDDSIELATKGDTVPEKTLPPSIEPSAQPPARPSQSPPPALGPANKTSPVPVPVESSAVIVPPSPTAASTTEHKSLVEQQVENFKKGTALLLNVHITHHAGTTFCGHLKRALKAPSFACMGARPEDHAGSDFESVKPWSHGSTEKRRKIAKKYFDVLFWEFGARSMSSYHAQLADTDWENPNLVSVIIMREPLSRLLAGDGYVNKHYPNVQSKNSSIAYWMEFAHDDKHNNNYALRILAGPDCCDGNNTNPIHLQHAKQLLSRFTYVLDMDCLNEGMQALVDQLGIDIEIVDKQTKRHHHAAAKDRIPFPEVYEYLRDKNKMDIALYEWSKTISLVDCSALDEEDDQEKEKEKATQLNDHGTKESVLGGTDSAPSVDVGSAKLRAQGSTALQQIGNFREGKSVLLNLHITHHAGTVVCGHLKQVLRHPSFACMGVRPEDNVGDDYPQEKPWKQKDTAKNIMLVKKYFDIVSWEFSSPPAARQSQLAETDWLNPNLVSMIVMREPISRIMAGDGYVSKKYPGVAAREKSGLEEWMDFARDDKHTNNFALRILAGPDCCAGNNTDPIHLQHAKEMLSKFTYILDMDCLNEGLEAMVEQLGLEIPIQDSAVAAKRHNHKPASELIPYPEVYDYLKERNKLDIELYEWSKTMSLVDCSSLQ